MDALHRFDQSRDGAGGAGVRGKTSVRDQEAGENGRALLCAKCGNPVTRDDERAEIDGSHEHTCVNPHGYSFHFGCFDHAPGAQPLGEQTAHYTWFPGYRWQLDYCRQCGTHLGWMFCTNTHRFHGLILDRLVEGDDS